MGEEKRPVRPVWLTLLTVTIATYLPFVWMLANPVLLLMFGGPLIPGLIVSEFLHAWVPLGPLRFLCRPFVLTALTLGFFTWLGRRGGRMRVVATLCAFVWGALLSAATGFLLAHFHT